MAQRAKIEVKGIVQGVGFRPFVYNLAESLGLKGYVTNTSEGVTIEVEGYGISDFVERLSIEAPPLSRIIDLRVYHLPIKGYSDFKIIESRDNGRFTLISPDVSVCDDCLRELLDPKDRRYLYPFINCTNCGPRYSITLSIPYDRPNTTMSVFKMCEECLREYHDPKNRRFHAQPNACPSCGPHVELRIANPVYRDVIYNDPILGTIDLLKRGAILTIKGLGGFHIACDAKNEKSVELLRIRKRKNNKPFALMAPDIDMVMKYCYCSDEERSLLISKRRPIVLLRKREETSLPEMIAPNNNHLGFMLPYTPLHYLLFYYPCDGSIIPHFDALVMTSGNLSEEPIIKDNDDAIEKMGGIVDAFLLHNRDIFMRVDDSVVRIDKREKVQFIRRSRGFVPEPIELSDDGPDVLGCGANLKNTFTITKGRFAIPGQHIGDMENYETLIFFEESLRNIKQIYRAEPIAIAYDLHPDYLSTRWAHRQAEKGLKTYGIQHHYAHIASVMAEKNMKDRIIGVALDGTGYGLDGCLWGGEFLIADINGFERILHFKYLPLPGGERAIKEPWRMTVSLIIDSVEDRKEGLHYLRMIGLSDRFGDNLKRVVDLIDKREFSPLTSSAGRLFDAVSAMLGLCYINTYEAEAAIALESLVTEGIDDFYEFEIRDDIDLSLCVRGILNDIEDNLERTTIATKFHNTVSEIILHAVKSLSNQSGIRDVVLSGGVFQNRSLLQRTISKLVSSEYNVHVNERVPCNDGGISLGQAYILRERIRRGINE